MKLPEEFINRMKEELSKTIRIWPHHAPGEGHFVALLKKKADEPTDNKRKN